MKKNNKRRLEELKIKSFQTTEKNHIRGGEDNPTCLPESCTGCDGAGAFA